MPAVTDMFRKLAWFLKNRLLPLHLCADSLQTAAACRSVPNLHPVHTPTHRVHSLLWVLSQLLHCQSHIDHLCAPQPHPQCVKQQRVTSSVLTLVLQHRVAGSIRQSERSPGQHAHMGADGLDRPKTPRCASQLLRCCQRSTHLVWCLHIDRLSCLWVNGHICVPARCCKACSPCASTCMPASLSMPLMPVLQRFARCTAACLPRQRHQNILIVTWLLLPQMHCLLRH